MVLCGPLQFSQFFCLRVALFECVLLGAAFGAPFDISSRVVLSVVAFVAIALKAWLRADKFFTLYLVW